MLNNWKPSRKTISIIVGLCAISGLIVWLNREKIPVALLSPDDIVTVKAQEVTERDTDGDGVRDWEEYLWGFNSEKKDSDGNGIEDAVELEKKKLVLKDLSEGEKVAEPATFTDNFSKEFFVAFAALKESGNLTQTNINNISQKSLEALTQIKIEDKYTTKNLLLSDSSKEAKDVYRRDLANMGKTIQIKELGKELELLHRAINKPRSDKLITSLTKTQSVYLDLAEKTIKIKVPSPIQNAHLNLANSYYKIGSSIGGLTNLYDDPALSIVYFSEYQNALETMSESMTTISTYMN